MSYLSHYFQTFDIGLPVLGTIGAINQRSVGQCATDTFAVSAGGSGRSSPVICGQNTGQHGMLIVLCVYALQ